MNNAGKRHTHNLAKQNIYGFSDRLAIAVKSVPNLELSHLTNISRNTLYQYANKESYPDIARLSSVAECTGYSVSWMLFGEERVSSKEMPYMPTFYFTMPDEAMSPIFPRGKCVLCQRVEVSENASSLAGLYIINTKQGDIMRELQWQEKEQIYLLLCSNPLHSNGIAKSVKVIGKVNIQ